MKQLVHWCRAWSARLRFRQAYRNHHGVLTIVDDGLELKQYRLHGLTTSLDTVWRINWNEVTKIVAFKRDCWTVDLLCLALELGGTELVRVDEEMQGWRALQGALSTHFGIQEESWFGKVAVPAFATRT